MKRLLLLFLLLMLPLCAPAENGFDLTVNGKIRGFTENAVVIRTEAAGVLTLSLSDKYGVYRTWELPVHAGENQLVWDGLGYNEERLPDGEYTLQGTLTTSDGRRLMSQCTVTLARCPNTLMFALPVSDTLYLGEDATDWYCEMRLVRSGDTIVAQISPADDPDAPIATLRKKVGAAGVVKFTWDGRINKADVAPGEYLLRCWAAENPAYVREVRVTVAEGKRPQLEVMVTGSIMPKQGMSDQEIWAIMQMPSVVADLKKQTDHLTIYSEKGRGQKLGTVHGQSQAMEVMRLEDGYAYVGAWNHESGSYVEGWVAVDDLMVVTPNSEYGILVDKETQTMTVYHRGTVVDTFPISTGLVAEDRLIRETPAGAYLTVDRISYFASEGYQYDYVIRYDGGNLIHQMGYDPVGSRRDFSDHAVRIGTKASHGCIRVSNLPGKGGVNAYWLYTHLPYGTRVILLDDPDQRLLEASAVGAQVDVPHTEPIAPPPLAQGETELVVTFGGDVVLGTREVWQNRSDALPAYIDRFGLTYPFRNLMSLFAQDDMTVVNLECVLKDDSRGEHTSKEYRFRGPTRYAKALKLSFVEQVSIANNHYIDYGTAGRDSTRLALADAGVAYSGFEYNYIWEQDGRKIGFGGCREYVFNQDPDVIRRDIAHMKQAGCDVIIYTCHWGTEYQANHNENQEQMAAAAVAAGADIVIGGHPHVVQGIGTVGYVPVVYSLGNLMFGGTIDMETFDGMLVQLRLRFDANDYTGCTLELIPVLTSGQADFGLNDYSPVIADGEDKERILQRVQSDTAFPLMEQMYFPAQ